MQKQLDEFKRLHDASNVDAALALLRQHLAKPPALFDPFTAMAALEQLLDTAREKDDDRAPALQRCIEAITGFSTQSSTSEHPT